MTKNQPVGISDRLGGMFFAMTIMGAIDCSYILKNMTSRQGGAMPFRHPNYSIETRGDGCVAGEEIPVYQRVPGF
ncbi:MAG: hypothetical protein ACRDBO_17005 [Lachnospiraceae bacterium]